MEAVEFDPHLSQMSTQWTMVIQAHSGAPDEAHVAATRLMCRYAGSVHRYLLKALKDSDAADELDQEFAVRFLRGDFRNCDPERGRFRDYVKRAVQNLIADYYRRKRPTVPLDASAPEPVAGDDPVAEFEQAFIESWRKDLLERAWNALAELERTTGQPYHTILRSKVSHPDVPSAQRAGQLATALNKPFTAGSVRQVLQRSRQKYVDYLVAEVRASLRHPTREDLEQELSDLNLLHYCRPFMKRRDGLA
jgi:RNA polymerase sigma-70 factor (ECF subfamily)